jgi:hypothetical protein
VSDAWFEHGTRTSRFQGITATFATGAVRSADQLERHDPVAEQLPGS